MKTRYRITLASHPICRLHPAAVGPVPSTARTACIDLTEGLGQTVWEGYQTLDQRAKDYGLHPEERRCTEKDKVSDRVREAFNIFCRFLAGEGRDNCLRVFDIKEDDTTDPVVSTPADMKLFLAGTY